MEADLSAEEALLAAQRRPYARLTVVWAQRPTSARPGDVALVTADGRLRGWVGGSCSEPVVVREALAALADGSPRLVRLHPGDDPVPEREGVVVAPVACASGGALEVFVDPQLPPAHLVAIGRSPLTKALATMAAAVGFDVVVVEREGMDPAEVPAARLVGELDLEKAGVGPESTVIVATMGRYDEDAVEAALLAGARSVGLVASAKRGEAVRDALRGGALSDADLARVKAPAGLDLGAVSHTDIAVAILAELVMQRATAEPAPVSPVTAVQTATDPVCGMTVEPGTAADTFTYAGVTYFFCASGCRRAFQADPESFLDATSSR